VPDVRPKRLKAAAENLSGQFPGRRPRIGVLTSLMPGDAQLRLELGEAIGERGEVSHHGDEGGSDAAELGGDRLGLVDRPVRARLGSGSWHH
jgi:hypothetical protein